MIEVLSDIRARLLEYAKDVDDLLRRTSSYNMLPANIRKEAGRLKALEAALEETTRNPAASDWSSTGDRLTATDDIDRRSE